jgi:hypothetical protein
VGSFARALQLTFVATFVATFLATLVEAVRS